MIQTLRKLVTFDEFVAKYPDNTGKHYELHDGAIVEMPQPTGYHEQIIVFLVQKFLLEYSRISLNYGIPKTVLVKPLESESAYSPDVLILNLPNLVNEPLWKKESTVSQAESIPLVVEVVSSNWRDDYLKKAADYEAIGIPEYWIVDYAALGGRRFIGNPKQPTVSVYTLIDGEYQVSQFQGSDACGGKLRIISPTFPELNLTAEQIFQAGGYPV
ncbi:MAG: Uma2 family endonuclease [Nostoc sp.]|uniref:Uma2 family endonuclease n=1 Tax=Nostoc sp. TaxID=1180 RepID=UPI002FF54527